MVKGRRFREIALFAQKKTFCKFWLRGRFRLVEKIEACVFICNLQICLVPKQWDQRPWVVVELGPWVCGRTAKRTLVYGSTASLRLQAVETPWVNRRAAYQFLQVSKLNRKTEKFVENRNLWSNWNFNPKYRKYEFWYKIAIPVKIQILVEHLNFDLQFLHW